MGASAPARRKASTNGNGNGKPSAAKAKAAVAEVTPDAVEQKVAQFRGITLVLNELPKTFLWDLAASDNNVLAYFQLVQSLLRPEQLGEVRQALMESDDDADTFIGELVEVVFSAYGLGLGESAASSDS
jgi:hypothetical protein